MIQESLVPKAGAQFPQRFWDDYWIYMYEYFSTPGIPS